MSSELRDNLLRGDDPFAAQGDRLTDGRVAQFSDAAIMPMRQVVFAFSGALLYIRRAAPTPLEARG
jgi:hypothetical protein